MGKTSAAAAAALLLNLCTYSHGQEMPPAARQMSNQRRSLRSGMTSNDFKGGEAQSKQFQTKISTTITKDVPKQNPFYNVDAFTAKEVSSYDKISLANNLHGEIMCTIEH